MAITNAAYLTVLDNLSTAISNETWADAWKYYAQAEAILAGLETEMGDQAARLRRRESLAGLRKALEIAQGKINTANEPSRIINTSMGRHR